MARPEVDHIVNGMQVCRRCKDNKPIDQFWKNRTKQSGYTQYCRTCSNLNHKESRHRIKKGTPKFRMGSMNSLKGTQAYKDYQRNWALQYDYNISLDDYNKLYNTQEGCCAICNRHQSQLKKSLHVDHDHTTSKVRGLLCHRCNMSLGQFEDSIEMLQTAVKYLENSKKMDLIESISSN